jgi:S-adenosylmethionine:diacylglycerol 3-amino-3-carboxypropyl transferase
MADNDRILKLLSAGSISQTRAGQSRQARRRRELSKINQLAASVSPEVSKVDKGSRVKIGSDRGLRAQKQVGARLAVVGTRPVVAKLSARRSQQIHQLAPKRSFSLLGSLSREDLASSVDLAKTSVARSRQSSQRFTVKRASLSAKTTQA